MGLSTHLGPWLLGTVKDTTGTNAALGQVRNVGATIAAQTKTVAFNDAAATVAAVLPAGALITNIQLIQGGATFTSGTTGTITLLLNGTTLASTTVTTGTAGTLSFTPASAAQAALYNNVGSVDASLTYTNSGLNAGSGTLVIAYMVRQADGTYLPTSFTV